MKIAVLGYSGSGKSTLSHWLGKRYEIPVLYLDTIQFEANWQMRKNEEALPMVAEFMENSAWVIDGNYRRFKQEERLDTADYIIFMNFNRFNCFFRALKRYFKFRNKNRESMANGCNEKFDFEFMWWILHQGRTKAVKERYKEICTQYADKTIMIKNQQQLDSFMKAPFVRF